MMDQRWTSACKLKDKKGNQVPLPEALNELDEIDFNRPPTLYEDYLTHDLILLALSADKCPTVIENMAKELRKALADR